MPSPFPGMDPFIESQVWRDFHTGLLLAIRRHLVPQVRPRYVVHVEEYVFLASEGEEHTSLLAPDVRIAHASRGWRGAAGTTSPNGALLEPVVMQTPTPEKYEQTYLEIRTREGEQVVTVIEILSPWNKAPGAGRTEYLNKRHNVFATPANLVEIDLLRGGERLPTTTALPEGDYYAFLTRRGGFPEVAVFAWTLRDKLPSIPIPLAEADADAVLDLQAAFDATYEDAGYDYSLNYAAPANPAFASDEDSWASEILRQAGKA